MAAFSYQPHPLLLDSNFLPNTPTKISGFMEEGNFNSNCFSQFYLPVPVQESPPDPMFHESSCIHHSSKVAHSDNEPSVTRKQSTDDSTVVDKLESGEQVTQNVTQTNRRRRTRNGFTLNSAQSISAKEGKSKRQKKSSEALKNEKKESKAEKKDEKKSPEEPPKVYIHTKARRGQATDSHSLAERVRREKISERMRILQGLVPGCDKVTGKAFMLDEIINYVQSLQNQVEFLLMKLASVNPMFYDFGVDLEALMVRPERVNGVASPLPSLQQCNPTQPTAFVDSATAILAPANNYPLLDASAAVLLHQGQRPIVFSQPQDSGSVLWDVEDQRQKLLNSSGLNDNLGCFH